MGELFDARRTMSAVVLAGGGFGKVISRYPWLPVLSFRVPTIWLLLLMPSAKVWPFAGSLACRRCGAQSTTASTPVGGSAAGGGPWAGIKRLEAAEHRPRPAGRDFKRDAT